MAISGPEVQTRQSHFSQGETASQDINTVSSFPLHCHFNITSWSGTPSFFLNCRPYQQSRHKAREPNLQVSHGELMSRALPGRMSRHRPQQMRARFNSIVQGKIGKHIPTGADYCSRGEIFHRIFSEGDACRQNGSKYIFNIFAITS